MEQHGSRRTEGGLRVAYDRRRMTSSAIRTLLDAAPDADSAQRMACHLVRAHFEILFGGKAAGTGSTATSQTSEHRCGEFLLNDTVFHIAALPDTRVFDRAQQSGMAGRRAYLLVREPHVQFAMLCAKQMALRQITVDSIEGFLGKSLDMSSGFSKDRLACALRLLLETYNQQVRNSETDTSLLVRIPRNLRRAL